MTDGVSRRVRVDSGSVDGMDEADMVRLLGQEPETVPICTPCPEGSNEIRSHSVPPITLVIPTIAPRRPLLARCLASVGAQTLLPAAIEIAEDTHRVGAARTRQAGFAQVSTPLTAFLDDDDELLPCHLDHLAAEMDRTGADVVFPWFTVIGGGDPFPMHEGKPWDNAAPRQFPVTFLARTDVIREAGGWTADWDEVDPEHPGTDEYGNRAGEDWRLILRLVANDAKIVHLPERTWHWRHDSQNTSGLPSRVNWNVT